MKCSRVMELLSPYVDDHLAGAPRNRVAAHLAKCSACLKVHRVFREISIHARALPDPPVPAGLWSRLEEQLDMNLRSTGTSAARLPWKLMTVLAVAATVLIAVGVFVQPHLPWSHSHDPLAKNVREFVETFHRNPEAAQQMLLARYGGRPLSPTQLAQALSFTPVAFRQPPNGYVFHRSYLLDMPCCRCSQAVYQRDDGGWVAVFEHDTRESPKWLTGANCVETVCDGHACTLAQSGSRLAATCKIGNRHFTIVGARDLDELKSLIAWLDTTADQSSQSS